MKLIPLVHGVKQWLLFYSQLNTMKTSVSCGFDLDLFCFEFLSTVNILVAIGYYQMKFSFKSSFGQILPLY